MRRRTSRNAVEDGALFAFADAKPHHHDYRARLRKRFDEAGPNALADYELLELLLFRTIPRRDTKPLAKALLAEFGDFAGVLAAPAGRIAAVAGAGQAVAQDLKAIQAAVERAGKAELKRRDVIGSFSQLVSYCRAAMAHAPREQVRVQLDEDPRVAWVAASGPADAAGVRVGDRLLAINGEPIPEERRADHHARRMLARAERRGPVELELQRGGQIFNLTVTPRESCAYMLYVADDDVINAFADSENIVLNRGMMRFVQSDEELAPILGHEFAHNALRHVQAGRRQRSASSVWAARARRSWPRKRPASRSCPTCGKRRRGAPNSACGARRGHHTLLSGNRGNTREREEASP